MLYSVQSAVANKLCSDCPLVRKNASVMKYVHKLESICVSFLRASSLLKTIFDITSRPSNPHQEIAASSLADSSSSLTDLLGNGSSGKVVNSKKYTRYMKLSLLLLSSTFYW